MGLDLVVEGCAKPGYEKEWRRLLERSFPDEELSEAEAVVVVAERSRGSGSCTASRPSVRPLCALAYTCPHNRGGWPA